MICPQCNSDRLTSCDKNKSGSQRYQCLDCKKKFTPKPESRRIYPDNAAKQKAYRKRKKQK